MMPPRGFFFRELSRMCCCRGVLNVHRVTIRKKAELIRRQEEINERKKNCPPVRLDLNVSFCCGCYCFCCCFIRDRHESTRSMCVIGAKDRRKEEKQTLRNLGAKYERQSCVCVCVPVVVVVVVVGIVSAIESVRAK